MADIKYYTEMHIGYREIYFPEDMIWCKHCDLAYKDSMGRSKCSVLDRQIFDPTTRWEDCPLMLTGERRGTEKNNHKSDMAVMAK